ncbi:MAG: hypothetical protein JXP34_06450 [Planctomycetes bacterium]|nr:hypothetical protein [Planctomycetota bacterium]
MLEPLKRLFRRGQLPEATRDLFRSARSTRELLEGLDRLIDRNRLAVRALERDIEKLEEGERAESERIRAGDLAPRARRNALRAIQRVRREVGHLEARIGIHDRNVALHQELVAKIQAVEAMRMRGVEEAHIDAVMTRFEAELDGYRSTLEIGEMAADGAGLESIAGDEELDRLEEEILSGKTRRPDPRRARDAARETAAAAGPERAPAGGEGERTRRREAAAGGPEAPGRRADREGGGADEGPRERAEGAE